MAWGCITKNQDSEITDNEKRNIRNLIQQNLEDGIQATREKNIEGYMSRLPKDLLIYDESGEIITREQQRAYAIRDWAIIDTTLHIAMHIDSMSILKEDCTLVYTSQRWERIMFQRDGVTTDTVVTTQRHKETWKKNVDGWFGYDIVELGGKIFINGEPYNPEQ